MVNLLHMICVCIAHEIPDSLNMFVRYCIAFLSWCFLTATSSAPPRSTNPAHEAQILRVSFSAAVFTPIGINGTIGVIGILGLIGRTGMIVAIAVIWIIEVVGIIGIIGVAGFIGILGIMGGNRDNSDRDNRANRDDIDK